MMHVTSLSDGVVRITREDGEFLGIFTGISKRTFHLTKLSEKKEASGLLIRGNTIEEWPIEGFIEAEGSIYLTGTYHEGILLSEVLRTPENGGIRYLGRLAAAYRLLEERNIVPYSIYTNGILFTEDDGVLFLPQKSMETINQHHPISYQVKYYERFNHPDLKEGDRISFALGIIAYRMLSGRFPFESEDESELHELIRSAICLPPLNVRPELRPDISTFINTALDGKNGPRPTFKTWLDAIRDWESGGITRSVSDEEKARIMKSGEEFRKKQNASFFRKTFFRKHGLKIAGISIVVLAVFWVGFSIIGNLLAPRVTRGFSPEQVVRTFYTSVNTLDHATMEDCVIDDAGKPYINEVMNYFVITRMRLSIEGIPGFIPAEEWDSGGRNNPPAGQTVYGILDLNIESAASPVPEEKSYKVTFEKWQPLQSEAAVDAGPSITRSEGREIQEKVFLRLYNGDWVIFRIENTTDTQIGIIESR